MVEKVPEQVLRKVHNFANGKPQLHKRLIDDLIASFRVKNGEVCGFKYADIRPKISPAEYGELLQLLGFDPLKIADYDDQECGPPCKPNFGHACDPVRCHGRMI